MIKNTLTIVLLLGCLQGQAQIKLLQEDLLHLIAIAELYSHNTNASGEAFAKSVDSLKSPVLNNIADALIAVGKGDTTIFGKRFMIRPPDEELYMWYVIREIHYNSMNQKLTSKPDIDVANEVLSREIDSRWLLDNYY